MRFYLYGFMLLLSCQPLWAAAKIDHWQTKHGSQVYFVHTEGLPMVDIRVTFDAGSARDGDQFGLAALTAALLDAGAGAWDADTVAERFESVGAEFGVGISMDTATLSLRTLTDKSLFNKALETMRVVLAQPRFADPDFQREQKRTLAAIKQQKELPGAVASIAFYQALYGNHPYAHPESGTLASVGALTVDDLKRFYQRHYVAANAQVVIVGDMPKHEAKQTAEKLMADLPTGQKPAALPDVAMPTKGGRTHLPFPSAQTHVMAGLPGINRNDPDFYDLYVGNHILGGSGLVSKLFSEVREKRGLAYSVSSAFVPLLKPGPFLVGLQTRNDQTEQALSVLNQTLSDFIANGPTEAELSAAKKNITGGFAMRFDTNKELANYASMIGFYGMPLDYLDLFPDRIEKVTVKSVTDAMRRRVDPALIQTITVGQGGE